MGPSLFTRVTGRAPFANYHLRRPSITFRRRILVKRGQVLTSLICQSKTGLKRESGRPLVGPYQVPIDVGDRQGTNVVVPRAPYLVKIGPYMVTPRVSFLSGEADR